MQIKTTMRYQLTQVKMAITKKLQTINTGQGVEKREPFYTCWWERKLVQPQWRREWGGSLKKQKTIVAM